MTDRLTADRWCRTAQESVLLAMVAAAPWAFGAIEPLHHAILLGGVAVLALIGGVRILLAPGAGWRGCPVAVLLGGFFLLTAFQLAPLPPAVLEVISPKSLEYYRDLLPTRPEVLPDGSAPASEPGAWHPISLYPFATRSFLIDLLALFVVAVIVRQQIASRDSWRRLAWVCFANGTALALFALAQSQSAPGRNVYWSIPTEGTVFGPFICRNHFPFYVSLCMGLAAGLLAGKPAQRRRHRPGSPHEGPAGYTGLYEGGGGPYEAGGYNTQPSLLQDPRQMWLAGGIALMTVACLFSMSRGGALALVGGTVLVLALARGARGGESWRPTVLAGGLGVAVLIALWLGSVPLESRLGTLGQSEHLWQGRVQIWRRVLPHLRDFPLFGSGGGTYEFVEPMYDREPARADQAVSVFAHNEYLEAAFEGGAPRLLLTLALVAAVIWLAWRGLHAPASPEANRRDVAERRRGHHGEPRASLSRGAVLGMLWGLLVVAAHSLLDFGIHMPAIALLTVVVAAYLSSARDPAPVVTAGTRPGPVGFAVAALTVPLALVLLGEAATSALAERYRQAAAALTRSEKPEEREAALPYWEAAVRLRPRNAVLHQGAGLANMELYQRGPAARRPERLESAIRHLVAARNLCPMLPYPHASLGEICGRLDRADTPVQYFERAARVLPSENEVWYGLGAAYLDAGRSDEAQAAWRRYLRGSDRLLGPLLDRAVAAWGVDAVCQHVLPDRPEPLPVPPGPADVKASRVWLKAGQHLFPGKDQAAKRRPFLEGALRLMDQEGESSAEASHDRATLQRALGRRPEATAAYREAISRAPTQLTWRLEFARFLQQGGQLEDARKELEAILAQSPGHGRAAELLLVVNRQIELRDN